MSPDDYDTDAYVRLAAAAVGLEIPAEYHQSVVVNFQRLAGMAGPLMEFQLPVELESASIFSNDER